MLQPHTQLKIFCIFVGFCFIALTISTVFTILTFHNTDRPTEEARCSNDPLNNCKVGVLDTTNLGTEICLTYPKSTGSSCTSTCHIDDLAGRLTCSSNNTCGSDIASDCLGWCNATLFDNAGDANTQPHPDCEGKLSFTPFFYWNATGSSNLAVNWLYYSDYTDECSWGVCTWYAVSLHVYSDPSSFYFTTTPLFYTDPRDFLNISNKECIRYFTTQMDTNFSTFLFREIYPDVFTDETLMIGQLIEFTYQCASIDETLFTNETFIQKRHILSSTPSTARNLSHGQVKFASILSGANAPVVRQLINNPKQPPEHMMKKINERKRFL
jgi:hypothetical protein